MVTWTALKRAGNNTTAVPIKTWLLAPHTQHGYRREHYLYFTSTFTELQTVACREGGCPGQRFNLVMCPGQLLDVNIHIVVFQH